MFSLRLVACGIVFLLLVPSSGSAEPDFNITEIDVGWQLASLPPSPDLEPITASAILEIASLPRALKARSTYLPAITEVAAANGVPPALVDAVVRIESRYDPTAIGSIGEIGLMQVRPKTAALLGFGILRRTGRAKDQSPLWCGVSGQSLATGRWKPMPPTNEIPRRAWLRQDERPQHRVLPKGSPAPCCSENSIGNSSWNAPAAAGDPHARPSKDMERKRPTKLTIATSKASRLHGRERIRSRWLKNAGGGTGAWNKKHRVGERARRIDRSARLANRTAARVIRLQVAMPKSRIASR
jgi:hypothetical protein